MAKENLEISLTTNYNRRTQRVSIWQPRNKQPSRGRQARGWLNGVTYRKDTHWIRHNRELHPAEGGQGLVGRRVQDEDQVK